MSNPPDFTACPSFGEGLNALTSQAMENPALLEDMIQATATRMQALRAELGQVSGVVASPPPGEGHGLALAKAAGAFMPGFGAPPHGAFRAPPQSGSFDTLPESLEVSPGATLTQKASLETLQYAPTPKSLVKAMQAINLESSPEPAMPIPGSHGGPLTSASAFPVAPGASPPPAPSPCDAKETPSPKQVEGKPIPGTNTIAAHEIEPQVAETQPSEEAPHAAAAAASAGDNVNTHEGLTDSQPVDLTDSQPVEEQSFALTPVDPNKQDHGNQSPEVPSDKRTPSTPVDPNKQGTGNGPLALPADNNGASKEEDAQPSLPATPNSLFETPGATELEKTVPTPKANKGDIYADGSYWKMRNYCNTNKRTCKASDAVIKMFKTEKGRQELHQLLKNHGTFENVELHISKWQLEIQEEDLKGGWEHQISLAAAGWTQDMIDNSYNWALARGLVQKSEIHGKDEWRIPTKRSFKSMTQRGQETRRCASTEMQDPDGHLLNPDDMNENMFVNGDPDSNPSTSTQQLNAGAAQAAMNAKVKTLPALQANQDPFGLLSTFIDGVGKKISKLEEEKDRLEEIGVARGEKIKDDLGKLSNKFEELYTKLLQAQQQNCVVGVPTSDAKTKLSKLLVECTQHDVKCNYAIVRARSVKAKKATPASSGSKPARVALKDRKKKERKESQEENEDEEQSEAEPKKASKKRKSKKETREAETSTAAKKSRKGKK